MKTAAIILMLTPIWCYPQICSDQIGIQGDKFSEKTTYYSPINEPIIFMKVVRNSDTVCYLNMQIKVGTYTVGKTGAKVLLDNGEIMSWPESPIKLELDEDAEYTASCFIDLTSSELRKLSKHHITDVKLYVYQSEVPNDMALRIARYAKCMMSYW